MGAWIEIYRFAQKVSNFLKSHPTMGAWIEIPSFQVCFVVQPGRTPRWVRGLKYLEECTSTLEKTVAPHDGCVD